MEQDKLRELLATLQAIRNIDPEFPLQYAVCLCEIALDEGLSLTTLAERTGLSLSTVSRIVGALSKHRQSGTPYELISVKVSETERRKKVLTLSSKGKAALQRILSCT